MGKSVSCCVRPNFNEHGDYVHKVCFDKHLQQKQCLGARSPSEAVSSKSSEGGSFKLPRSSMFSAVVSEIAKPFSQADADVLFAYMMHSHASHDVLRRLHDVYRQSTESQLAQNIQHLFRMLPHFPLRSPLVGILTRNVPMADAISLTGASSAYVNRAGRSPPADSSPFFIRYPHGVHRDKVKNVERERTVALLTEHALIKFDAAKRPAYLHYDTCSEFFELYRARMSDICSSILALVEAEVVDRDDDLSSFMRRNIDFAQEFSSTFLALQESLPELCSRSSQVTSCLDPNLAVEALLSR